MDAKAGLALKAALSGFESGRIRPVQGLKNYDAVLFGALQKAFDQEATFLEKVSALDSAIDAFPEAESIRELLFDLLMIRFFSADVQRLDEGYLDSPEWENIENKTLDRGTELLNVLLYLRECEEEEIEPELSDYLREFLLVEEEEFQDECLIYEDIIANQMLMESSLDEIARVAETIDPESEMKQLFYPLMVFFHNPLTDEKTLTEALRKSPEPAFDGAALAMLLAYYRGSFPGINER
jgi:hypothetical protein